MDKEISTGVLVFVILFMGLQMLYVKLIRSEFVADGQKYEQVGLMEVQDTNGATLYTPVYKKRK